MYPLTSSRPAGAPVYDTDSNASPSAWSSFVHALLATAIFRCWHILIFFAAWSTAICVISHDIHSLALQPTLITVFGTVLGFVISYRTTSSFERYNEGRRLWSQIVLGSRTFARLVWLHVPDNSYPLAVGRTNDEKNEDKAKTLVEKKTIINLIEAFAVAVKHYLRGEEGIHYEDLYHLVKFLPAYALPATIPSVVDLSDPRDSVDAPASRHSGQFLEPGLTRRTSAPGQLPLPTTARTPTLRVTDYPTENTLRVDGRPQKTQKTEKMSTGAEFYLSPARNPPKYTLFDLFPFSLLIRMLTTKGVDVRGKTAARMKARMGNHRSYNIPLELSLYLGSYISALQLRKCIDPPTTTLLLGTLGQLVDALTGLERILTTPIPFSYSIHLWLVTLVYCLALPFQVWSTLKWFTIPATTLASFIFFGFLVAGEEIENPFGYDKNDLNMDHFVHNIIRKELHAIMAMPTPDPAIWAFSSDNDLLFANSEQDERVPPSEWVRRGVPEMRASLKFL